MYFRRSFLRFYAQFTVNSFSNMFCFEVLCVRQGRLCSSVLSKHFYILQWISFNTSVLLFQGHVVPILLDIRNLTKQINCTLFKMSAISSMLQLEKQSTFADVEHEEVTFFFILHNQAYRLHKFECCFENH